MTSYLVPKTGFWRNESIPSKSGQAYAEGEAVYNDGTNDVPATSSTKAIRGICREAKAASPANTNNIVIAVPTTQDCTFEADVSGTLTAAMVGTEFDLATSTTVNQAASTYDAVRLVKFISATKGEFQFVYSQGANAT